MMQPMPLLFWALHFLIGSSFALFPHWAYLIPLAFLSLLSKRRTQDLIFLAAGWGFTLFKTPACECEQLTGRGVFILESIQPSQSPFSRSLAIKGTFKCFESEGKFYPNIPCTLFQSHIPKGTKWLLKGTLHKKNSFIFKPEKYAPWKEIPSSFSLTKWRYQSKEHIRKLIRTKVKEKKVAHFFSSMATGNLDDRLLSMEFRKVGLSHILAISGFHFALIAGMVGWFFQRLFPQKIAYLLLLAILLFYFIFLGATASILRSFIMISLYVVGRILHRKVDILNLLGMALLIELISNPRVLTQVDFQLSFLATMGILLFYSPFNRLLEKIFPKRSFFETQQLSRLDQHGYLLSSSIRQALALNLAVHCTTLPALAFLFHSFPLLSLPYNLLLPPLLGLSLLLLPFCFFFPPLRLINEHFTGWLLRLIASAPEGVNYQIFIQPFPFALLIGILSAVLAIGLTKRVIPTKIA